MLSMDEDEAAELVSVGLPGAREDVGESSALEELLLASDDEETLALACAVDDEDSV